ncbi:MAG: hypothetical protein IJ019_00675 [Alphaproteobacteria bacterium]|nr:hypothetical protein [Alphaproteobacteria bacterium]
MKKCVFVLLCAVIYFGASSLTALAQENQTTIRVAATSNLSDAPADEALKKMVDFLNGDSSFELNEHSPREVRKEAVKMAFELCKAKKISYDHYADICRRLHFRAKSRSKCI